MGPYRKINRKIVFNDILDVVNAWSTFTTLAYRKSINGLTLLIFKNLLVLIGYANQRGKLSTVD